MLVSVSLYYGDIFKWDCQGNLFWQSYFFIPPYIRPHIRIISLFILQYRHKEVERLWKKSKGGWYWTILSIGYWYDTAEYSLCQCTTMPSKVYSFERRHCSVFSDEGVQFGTAEVFNDAAVFNTDRDRWPTGGGLHRRRRRPPGGRYTLLKQKGHLRVKCGWTFLLLLFCFCKLCVLV